MAIRFIHSLSTAFCELWYFTR